MLKWKQPEERHALYLAPQTSPHVPAPPGQVLLQRFSQVPQNARDPTANVGSIEKTITDRIVANAKSPIAINCVDSSIEAFSLSQSSSYVTIPIRESPTPRCLVDAGLRTFRRGLTILMRQPCRELGVL